MADEVVGSAYVIIRAITSKIRDDIRDGVKRGATQSKSDLEDAGESIGEAVGTKAGETAGERVSDGVRRKLRDDRGRFRAAGGRIGDEIGDGLRRGGWLQRMSRAIAGAIGGAGSGIANTARGFGDSIGKSLSGATSGLSGLRIGIFAIIGIIPLLTSGLSALLGTLVAFTGAVAQASVSVVSAVGVIGSLIQAKLTLKLATSGLTEALNGEEGAMAKLAPSAQALVSSLRGLKDEWTDLQKSVQQAVFAGVGDSIERVAEAALPTLQKGLTGTGRVLNGVIKDVLRFAATEGFVRRFGRALEGNNKILEILGKAAVPILDGMLRLFRALQPAGRRLARNIVDVAKGFQEWTSAPGFMQRVDDKMKAAFKSARNLWGIIRNLGGVLRNVFGAATPAGDGLLKTLNRLSGRLLNFTEKLSTKNAIADWAEKGIEVTGQLFNALGRGFNAIKGLFDPAILGGFLTVLEKVMPTLTDIVGVFQDALAPVLEKIGEALEENGPKFAELFKALAPLLKGIGSVIGELISQSLDLLGTIAAVITPVVAAISNFVGPILTRFAPIIAAIILAFTNWGSAIVKLIPIIGKFLAPLVQLTGWLIKKLAPAFKFVGGLVVGVFRLWFRVIGATLGFISKIISSTFGFIGKFVPNVISRVGGAISRGFNAAKKVVGDSIGAIWKFVSDGFGQVMDFLGSIPGKLLNLAGAFLNAGTELGRKIINGLQEGVKGAAGLITDIAGNVWDAVKGFLNSAIDKINAALEFEISIPGPNIHINPPNIPRLATGGRASQGTLAVIGEGKEAETVLPDSLLRGLIERANSTGADQERERLLQQTNGPAMLVQIDNVEAHDYDDFMRQLQRRTRLQSLGGRRVPYPNGGAA